ncbi:MAG: DUF885 family protein [Gemmatimonadota bacterium]|nr:DUF885 family protein [Gemmatimonadota bacterium]
MSMRTITASPVTRRPLATRSLASWCIATGVTLAILATAPLGAQLGGSADMPGVNDRPNPYRTVEGWAQLPVGRVWGSTSAVAIDRDGVSVWVAERCGQNSCVGSELDPILLFDRTGRLVRSFGKGMINWPHGIHVDREGNVWVVDGRDNRPATRPGEPAAAEPARVFGHQVIKFSPTGQVLLRLGTDGGAREPGYFFQPNAVITAPNGDIYVAEGHASGPTANARILKFDRAGRFLASWGKKGTGPLEFDQPHALAFDSQGRLFVGDRTNNRIQILSQDGRLLDTWYQFSRASGIWIDADDTIYVADSESGSIEPSRTGWQRGIRIGSARTGAVTAFIPDPVTSTRGTSAAEGVAVARDGTIYGAEVGPRALKRYERSRPIPVGASELRDTIALYSTDRAALGRRWTVEYSPARRARFARFHTEWQQRLARVDFAALSQEGKIDHLLLATRVQADLDQLGREERLTREMAPYVPFAATITGFEEARRRFERVDPQGSAKALAAMAAQLDSLTRAIRARPAGSATRADRIVGLRTIAYLDELTTTLRDWNRFSSGYDPVFTWWTADPYRRVGTAMTRYATAIREVVVGQKAGEEEPIIGDPIGAEGLAQDLRAEMIAYTPQDLIALAEREFAWIEAEQKKASREMGFGEDWRAALEAVKQAYVPPGEQPELVRRLAREAVAFITERDLITVPPLADEVWRMEMMSPRQQLVSPFFLGGEIIQVSYPTDSMAHDDKLMSMRGNNPHFSMATVHHELIPGHHLQGYMTARYNTHRNLFGTPFWTEGWSLYWEMLLWDLGFPKTPQDRMGMLFWRSHRLARIIFSLKVHLGQMTPQEAVDFLVTRVGHERANAEAEVRRSFNGTYSPLYQAGYMIGGLQIRSLHRELVQSGRMTNRDFHDAIMQGGRMPIEMVRARLMGTELKRDHRAAWKFIQ